MVNNLSLVYTASVPEVEIESFVSINSGLEKSQFSGDFRIENDEFNHPRGSERKTVWIVFKTSAPLGRPEIPGNGLASGRPYRERS
ncbi:hypothetical protein PJI16_15415 [Nitrospira sp. MA-1]|nr:hypothetical protein [Nitrospira sp. MA-1]